MATMMNRSGKNDSGQAIIELALTLPLLLLVVLGVFDFGLMFSRYEAVTNAAREGARVAVLADYKDPHQSEIHAANYVRASGITATPTYGGCVAAAVTANRLCIQTEDVTETIPASGGFAAKTVDAVRVTVTYDHGHVFVGPIMGLFGGPLVATRLSAVSRMRKEP